jgi:RNA 3'-terminal phosphate cyclase (ATP)
MTPATVELDGSRGEGGGQILRSSLTLSLLTGRPFRLRNVRAKRAKPGLQPQHLTSVRAAAAVGAAAVTGDRQGSTDLLFEPGEVTAGDYHFPIGTAGATGLVLQTVLLPLALRGRGPSTVQVSGGTHVTHSPCFDFLETTWRAYLREMGIEIGLEMLRPGFYPRGGGLVRAEVRPAAGVRPLHVRKRPADATLSVRGFSAVARLPESIAQRQADQVMKRFRRARLTAEIECRVWPEGGTGTVVALVLDSPPVPTVFFFFGLGARGKPAERVADEAVDQLLEHVAHDATAVDAHSADQIVLPLALAPGPSRYPVACVTQHLLTNIATVRAFLERDIRCDGDEGRPGVVEVV